MKLFLLSVPAVALFLQTVSLEQNVELQIPGVGIEGLPLVSGFDRLKDVTFRLYTKENKVRGEPLTLDDRGASLLTSNFNVTNPTRFLIHGWTQNGSSETNQVIRDAYNKRSDPFNLIVVDWGAVAETPVYIQASLGVPKVGLVVAEMILYLHTNALVSPTSVTVIGHSLGAQVAGYAGKCLPRPLRLGNIVALDPANPLFARTPLTIHPVGSGDAINVQSIQTNRGVLGQNTPIGHSSFYPNYGPTQPGCGITDVVGLCAHCRSYWYYAESVATTKPFLARRCQNQGQILLFSCTTSSGSVPRYMGGDPLDAAASGIYYLKTNAAIPFSKGAEGIL